ncbi:alpha/beta hydrolase family protein [Nocardia wallacei]|uniref:alpha/beta hydrolase family protein n=1 Tax=Nocardia wallacei TaxID=480035 RepID=UPI002453DBD5|nr:dienelactone hydrolase family protein [Nocardia wallacei]
MPSTLLPAPTGPHAIGCRRLFLTDTGRTDPISGSGARKISTTAWYPTIGTGTVARYLSNVDTYDGTLAIELTNRLEGRNCNNWFGGSCFGVNINATIHPRIRARDTHAIKDAPIRTDLGTLPVVLYSPGYQVPGAFGSILAEQLASWGYLVLTLSHTYESAAVEWSNGVIVQNSAAINNQWQKVLVARADDAQYVMDTLASLPGVGAQADPDAIAMVGHSYGGYTALELAYHDPRIKAVAVLDGTAGYPGTENHAQDAGWPGPVLLLSGELDPGDGYLVGGEHPSWATYTTHPHGPLYALQVLGARHHAFTDFGLLTVLTADQCGTIAPSRAMEIHPRFVRAFLDTHLRGTPDALLDGTDPSWPDVVPFQL